MVNAIVQTGFSRMEKSCVTMDHGHPRVAWCGFKVKDNEAEEVKYLFGSHTHRHLGNGRTRRMEGVVAREDSSPPGDQELIIHTWRGLIQRRVRR